MLLIDEVLVSEDVLEKRFVCNLTACKGACCWEGDWGAPLDGAELEVLSHIREKIRPYLTSEGNEVIDQIGPYTFYEEPKKFGTPLRTDGACAYLTYDILGIAKCGIEKAHEAEIIDFKKPISCHLYPIRYDEEEHLGFKALNYDRWDICTAACKLGDKLKVPLYQFVKNALVRKFGSNFYAELEEVAKDLS